MNSAKQHDIKLIFKIGCILYTSNELSEREIKKSTQFTSVLKYLRINLTKEVKDWCLENNKTLNKEIEEDTN